MLPLRVVTGVPRMALLARPPLAVACALLVVSGFGYAYALGIQQAFLDSVPEELRGQAFGLNTTGLMGGQGLCPAVAGAIAGALGPGMHGPAVVIAGCGAAVLMTAALWRPLGKPREMSEGSSMVGRDTS